jgi:hypothetical protein
VISYTRYDDRGVTFVDGRLDTPHRGRSDKASSRWPSRRTSRGGRAEASQLEEALRSTLERSTAAHEGMDLGVSTSELEFRNNALAFIHDSDLLIVLFHR